MVLQGAFERSDDLTRFHEFHASGVAAGEMSEDDTANRRVSLRVGQVPGT